MCSGCRQRTGRGQEAPARSGADQIRGNQAQDSGRRCSRHHKPTGCRGRHVEQMEPASSAPRTTPSTRREARSCKRPGKEGQAPSQPDADHAQPPPMSDVPSGPIGAWRCAAAVVVQAVWRGEHAVSPLSSCDVHRVHTAFAGVNTLVGSRQRTSSPEWAEAVLRDPPCQRMQKGRPVQGAAPMESIILALSSSPRRTSRSCPESPASRCAAVPPSSPSLHQRPS